MKEVENPKKARVALGQHDLNQARAESIADAPDFTPAQLKWLKERTREFEKDYRPTRTLIEGL
ncbi:MAG TPA: hypothetical protein VM240_01085 [Verrucomicrobiae bacterium]|nr:hypothetical protein [Verrucomicrobiae bacterium]